MYIISNRFNLNDAQRGAFAKSKMYVITKFEWLVISQKYYIGTCAKPRNGTNTKLCYLYILYFPQNVGVTWIKARLSATFVHIAYVCKYVILILWYI